MGTGGGRDEEGAAAVEMAVVTPILVLLLFGTIQFGLAFFEWQGLQAAAREGARLASLSGAPEWSEVTARVEAAAAEIQGGTITVELERGGAWTTPAPTDHACDGLVDRVRLRVAYAADYEINAILFAASVPMAAEAEFRCEVS